MKSTTLLSAILGMGLLAGVSSQAYTFTATGSGNVTAYFVGQSAGYGSVIGMSVNGGAVGVFGLQNHSSNYGDSLVLGSVNNGDVITFVMQASFNFNGPPNVDLTWYSDPSLNSDGFDHIYSTAFAGDSFIPAGTYVGFEDLPGLGDQDFDDHEFVFTGPFRSTGGQGTPEAGTTLAMLGLSSIGLLAVRSRRK